MFNFHDFDIQVVAQFFQAHPYSASILTYLISFVEAMAVIGMFIPGAIAMPAIGFLIGSNIIPAGSTFMWAILGALTGDCLSYWIGVYFQGRIHRMWPFTRWPTLIERSEKFFHHHGGKSVFIGRFVGPMRAMIPMISGMLKMSFPRFLFAAVTSAILWALSYMVPGALLGALSLELPAKVATKFVLGALLAVVILWLVVWLMKHYFKQIWQMVDYYIMQLWRFCQKQRKLVWLPKFLSDPKAPDNHHQLTLVLVVLVTWVLFWWVFHQILVSGILISVGHSLYYLLSSLRFAGLDHFFIWVTLFGDLTFLLIISALVFFWLIWKRQWYCAAHWFGIVALSGFMVTGIKFLMCAARPEGILYGLNKSSFFSSFVAKSGAFQGILATISNLLHALGESSFPSAHSTISLALYGFLAVIIARESTGFKKTLTYLVAGTLVSFIAFSRLYLGAHWLIDIVGAILLGLMILLVGTISYRRHHVSHFNVREFRWVVIGILTIVWLGYSALEFSKQAKEYTLVWPHEAVKFSDLIKKDGERQLPLYRLNRLGRPVEAFNIAYVGEITKLSQVLVSQGWEAQLVGFELKNLLNHLSMLPQLYHGKKAALLLTKPTKQDGKILILRLWASDIKLQDNDEPFWIGTIECHKTTESPTFSLKHLNARKPFVGGTEFLIDHLTKSKFTTWKKQYALAEQSLEMRELEWDGKLLIIKSR